MVRMMKYSALAVLAIVFVGLTAQTALAVEGAGGPRGSGLIFPYFNQSTGYRTFMRVTYAPQANFIEPVDVALHNIYLEPYRDPFAGGTRCREFDRLRPVTRNDAEIWEVRSEAPSVLTGFAITYLVVRSEVAGVIQFGGQAGYDTLFGDSVVISTAEGWIVGISGIPLEWDRDAIPILSFLALTDPNMVLAQAHGSLWGGPDGNIIDYNFVTFGNHFYLNFFNERIGVDPTEVVILPFTLFDITGTRSWAQPRESFDGATNQWTWGGNWYDHDENPRNIPPGRINCWGYRTVNDLTLTGASTAPAGYGWIELLTDIGFRGYLAADQMAVLFQLEDRSTGGFGWGFYTPRRADDLTDNLGGYFWPTNDGKTTVEVPNLFSF